jgi:hypothetical protein
VFVGTEGGGLSLLDPTTRQFQPFNIHPKRKITDSTVSILALKMTRKKDLSLAHFKPAYLLFSRASGSYKNII